MGGPRRVRDYRKVERRLRRAAGARLRELCRVNGFALHWLEIAPAREARRSVVLTAGIHGDEPAGVEAVLRFLEGPLPRWARGIRFLVFPCMNPFGFERNQRHNHLNADINREYHREKLAEVAAQKSVLGGRRFDLHLTLHEDVDAPGFYIYELSRTPRLLGARIVRNVARVLPVDARAIIEHRRARGGVIWRRFPPRDMKTWPEAIYMFARHADHTLTTETPARWEFERRAEAQWIAMRTACEGL